MKKSVLILTSFIVLLGCKKDDNIPIPQSIVVGDYSTENLCHTDIQPDVMIGGRWEDVYNIDADDNSVDDFEIKIHCDWIQGGSVYSYTSVKINTLSEDAFVSIDKLNNPNILYLNDTLYLDSQWAGGSFLLISKRLNNFEPPFVYDYTISGIWNNINEAYIGIKLKEYHIGWIKVDVSTCGTTIYEYAIVN